MSTSNATPNYQVTAESAAGLLFKNKRDRKILNVDPKVLTVDLHSFSTLVCTISNWVRQFDIKTFCARNDVSFKVRIS